MAQRKNEADFRALMDRFSRDLLDVIHARVQEEVATALARLRPDLRADGRRAGRLCPVPGCGEVGAGPRNRWFCREHASKLSAAEQKGILERNKRLANEGKLPTAVPAQRIVRLPPREQRTRRALDMSCRVDGCGNRSRGPRAGFICDAHRAELSPEDQKSARDRWNARMKGKSAPPAIESAKLPAAVPPIVRKAEPAQA
jgi:hypothetical protein